MSFDQFQRFCILDYETYSEADLKKVGGYEYSVHPSTEILCAAWRIGTIKTLSKVPTQWWAPSIPDGGNFSELYQAFADKDVILVAHNAYFEQVITRNVFAERHMYSKKAELHAITPNRWVCTASLASALALPRNLEGAANALQLKVRKDMEGRRLLMRWCKPRKPTKNNPSTRHDDPAELMRLVEYCKTDIDTETALFLTTPPLTPKERRIWQLDQAINLRGFLVDRPLVDIVLKMIEEETTKLNEEVVELTFGDIDSAKKVAGVHRFLQGEGLHLPNLKADTVENALSTGLATGDAKRMLEIRQAVSKSSTAKYTAFEMRSRHDSRLRDILVYHGPSTGRWGGAGVQPQNFPRGTISDPVGAAEVLADGDLETVRMLYGNPMNVFSSCLRGMIIAPPSHVLDVADYAAVEARVLFWLARHEKGVKAFRDGAKLYEELAAKIFGVKADTIAKGSLERFVGKTATLGAGYQLGWSKFQASCANFGQPITEELAKAAINAYRTEHAPVVELWDKVSRAAIAAVDNVGKKYTVNGYVSFFKKGDFLFAELPSGRRLAYHKPEIRSVLPPWGGEDKRRTLFHWGVDSKTHKWALEKTYGGKLVENLVQAISRDLMAEAMLRIEETGKWKIVLTVHDELVAERKKPGPGTNKEFCRLMAALPPWAKGCPIAVEGFYSQRYRK